MRRRTTPLPPANVRETAGAVARAPRLRCIGPAPSRSSKLIETPPMTPLRVTTKCHLLPVPPSGKWLVRTFTVARSIVRSARS